MAGRAGAPRVATTGAVPIPRKRLAMQRATEQRTAYLFIAPWVIGFLVFTLGAMIFSFGLSLFESDLLSQSTFVGVRNYTY